MLITLGRLIKNGRREKGLSQRELTQLLGTDICPDWMFLSRLENDRISVNNDCYDPLIQRLSEVLEVELEYLEQIRQQTKVQSLDSTYYLFPLRYSLKIVK